MRLSTNHARATRVGLVLRCRPRLAPSSFALRWGVFYGTHTGVETFLAKLNCTSQLYLVGQVGVLVGQVGVGGRSQWDKWDQWDRRPKYISFGG